MLAARQAQMIGASVGLAVATPVAAHHAGGLGNTQGAGPIITISTSTLEQGHSSASITIDYQEFERLSMQTLINAAAAGEDVHGLRTTQAYAFTYAYGVTNDLTFGFRLPWVRRTGIRAAEEDGLGGIEVEDHGPADGLGDITLFGQYRFYHQAGVEAALLFGLKTPTGETNERTREGEVFEAEFQPGSGSWDPLLGLAFTHRNGMWSFDTGVLYSLSTTGTQGTDLGDRFQYNFAVSYRLAGLADGGRPMFHGGHSHEDGTDGRGHVHAEAAGPALDLVLEMNGEWHAKEDIAGVTDDNSGGNAIWISPGVRLSGDQWSSFVSVGVPVLEDWNGIQAEPEWRILSGASVSF